MRYLRCTSKSDIGLLGGSVVEGREEGGISEVVDMEDRDEEQPVLKSDATRQYRALIRRPILGRCPEMSAAQHVRQSIGPLTLLPLMGPFLSWHNIQHL